MSKKYLHDIWSSGFIGNLYSKIPKKEKGKKKKNCKILCIIPARSGSKGIKDKNIKNFNGHPLMCWSINQAKASKYLKNMKIIVSTDCENYANIAKSYGAQVPMLRPKDISQDKSTDYEFVSYTLKWLRNNENYNPDIILQLRPTQPLRKVSDIDNAIQKFLEVRNYYDSLRSVVEFPKSPYKMYNIKDDKLIPLYDNVDDIIEPINQCRQILPKVYLHNGYIDILNTDIVENGTVSGQNIYPYLMDEKDTIDIDTPEDWIKAEKALTVFE